jgi:hypothetical protein
VGYKAEPDTGYTPSRSGTKLQTQPVATGVFFLRVFTIIAVKMIPHDLKNGLERRVPRFCTICDKNQPLNEKNEKVMAILVPIWA